jgi:ElaB/YqjD/DUF883 family membrane-anchored ribosome-binding protein
VDEQVLWKKQQIKEHNMYTADETEQNNKTLKDTATQKMRDVGGEAYEKVEKATGHVYDQTAQVLDESYKQVNSFVNENPQTTALMAFGVGLTLGLLLASGGWRSTGWRPYRHYGAPIMDALYNSAMAFVHR